MENANDTTKKINLNLWVLQYVARTKSEVLYVANWALFGGVSLLLLAIYAWFTLTELFITSFITTDSIAVTLYSLTIATFVMIVSFFEIIRLDKNGMKMINEESLRITRASSYGELQINELHAEFLLIKFLTLCGPSLLLTAFKKYAITSRIISLNMEVFTQLLTVLFVKERRCSFQELNNAVSDLSVLNLSLSDLNYFSGILILKQDPTGLSLNESLQQEIKDYLARVGGGPDDIPPGLTAGEMEA